MTCHFCTYFDQNYLVRALTLHRSLSRHGGPFVLWALCLDDVSYETLERLSDPTLRPVRLAELETDDRELAGVRPHRTPVEYYFTLTPAWPRFLLQRQPEIDLITYVDADLLFFSSPEPLFKELGDDSVLIVGHRFPERLRHLESHGIFNVGYLSFRNDQRGRERLAEWRAQCIEWCHDRVEDGKFADQKYLDRWPSQPGVKVLEHAGGGLAPWNWMSHRIAFSGDAVFVDGKPLIFFHFHGLKILNRWLFRASEGYGEMPGPLRRRLYGAYLRQLAETSRWLRAVVPETHVASATVRQARHTFRDTLYWWRTGQLYTCVGAVRV